MSTCFIGVVGIVFQALDTHVTEAVLEVIGLHISLEVVIEFVDKGGFSRASSFIN